MNTCSLAVESEPAKRAEEAAGPGIGQLFTAGPPVVLGGTEEDLTKEELGGAAVHRRNGSVEWIVATEADAFEVIRRFLSYLPRSVFETPPVAASPAKPDRPAEELLAAVPRNPRERYRIGPIMEAIFDAGSVLAYAEYGGATVTALARLGRHLVGVIASDPFKGATMSAEGAQAVTRLVDLCETFHLPIVSLTDQAGMITIRGPGHHRPSGQPAPADGLGTRRLPPAARATRPAGLRYPAVIGND